MASPSIVSGIREKLQEQLRLALAAVLIGFLVSWTLTGILILSIVMIVYGGVQGLERLGSPVWLNSLGIGLLLLFLALGFLRNFSKKKRQPHPTPSLSEITSHWLRENPWTSMGLSAALGFTLAKPWRHSVERDFFQEKETAHQSSTPLLWDSMLTWGLKQYLPVAVSYLTRWLGEMAAEFAPQKQSSQARKPAPSEENAVPSPS